MWSKDRLRNVFLTMVADTLADLRGIIQEIRSQSEGITGKVDPDPARVRDRARYRPMRPRTSRANRGELDSTRQ